MEILSSRESIREAFDRQNYVVDNELSTVVYLMQKLNKPLLLEGNPGVGKTAIASVLANALDTELIRLQCYEGLDVNSAVYEWNYQKQLLSIKIQEAGDRSEEEKEEHIFSKEFLMPRPLMRAITSESGPPVLLIDEVDRADEEFEAFLLELLSEYQISIPEFGTIKASNKPLVVLTSNRTRELSDALKRRCLYHWVEYPELEKEVRIVKKHRPDIDDGLAARIVSVVHEVRKMRLSKTPGIAETVDWVNGLLALGYNDLTAEGMNETLGCLLKSADDMRKVREEGLDQVLAAV
jgi:MoxR-like ATPase